MCAHDRGASTPEKASNDWRVGQAAQQVQRGGLPLCTLSARSRLPSASSEFVRCDKSAVRVVCSLRPIHQRPSCSLWQGRDHEAGDTGGAAGKPAATSSQPLTGRTLLQAACGTCWRAAQPKFWRLVLSCQGSTRCEAARPMRCPCVQERLLRPFASHRSKFEQGKSVVWKIQACRRVPKHVDIESRSGPRHVLGFAPTDFRLSPFVTSILLRRSKHHRVFLTSAGCLASLCTVRGLNEEKAAAHYYRRVSLAREFLAGAVSPGSRP